MPTREELSEALRKADAAGAADDARQLALAIRELDAKFPTQTSAQPAAPVSAHRPVPSGASLAPQPSFAEGQFERLYGRAPAAASPMATPQRSTIASPPSLKSAEPLASLSAELGSIIRGESKNPGEQLLQRGMDKLGAQSASPGAPEGTDIVGAAGDLLGAANYGVRDWWRNNDDKAKTETAARIVMEGTGAPAIARFADHVGQKTGNEFLQDQTGQFTTDENYSPENEIVGYALNAGSWGTRNQFGGLVNPRKGPPVARVGPQLPGAAMAFAKPTFREIAPAAADVATNLTMGLSDVGAAGARGVGRLVEEFRPKPGANLPPINQTPQVVAAPPQSPQPVGAPIMGRQPGANGWPQGTGNWTQTPPAGNLQPVTPPGGPISTEYRNLHPKVQRAVNRLLENSGVEPQRIQAIMTNLDQLPTDQSSMVATEIIKRFGGGDPKLETNLEKVGRDFTINTPTGKGDNAQAVVRGNIRQMLDEQGPILERAAADRFGPGAAATKEAIDAEVNSIRGEYRRILDPKKPYGRITAPAKRAQIDAARNELKTYLRGPDVAASIPPWIRQDAINTLNRDLRAMGQPPIQKSGMTDLEWAEIVDAYPTQIAHSLQSSFATGAREASKSMDMQGKALARDLAEKRGRSRIRANASNPDDRGYGLLYLLEQAVPDYRDTRVKFGHEMGARDALTLPERFLSIADDEVKLGQFLDDLDELTPAQFDAAKSQITSVVRNAMGKKIENPSLAEVGAGERGVSTPNLTQLSKRGVLEALEKAFGGDGKQLADAIRLSRATTNTLTKIEPDFGPRTASNIKDAESAPKLYEDPTATGANVIDQAGATLGGLGLGLGAMGNVPAAAGVLGLAGARAIWQAIKNGRKLSPEQRTQFAEFLFSLRRGEHPEVPGRIEGPDGPDTPPQLPSPDDASPSTPPVRNGFFGGGGRRTPETMSGIERLHQGLPMTREDALDFRVTLKDHQQMSPKQIVDLLKLDPKTPDTVVKAIAEQTYKEARKEFFDRIARETANNNRQLGNKIIEMQERGVSDRMIARTLGLEDDALDHFKQFAGPERSGLPAGTAEGVGAAAGGVIGYNTARDANGDGVVDDQERRASAFGGMLSGAALGYGGRKGVDALTSITPHGRDLKQAKAIDTDVRARIAAYREKGVEAAKLREAGVNDLMIARRLGLDQSMDGKPSLDEVRYEVQAAIENAQKPIPEYMRQPPEKSTFGGINAKTADLKLKGIAEQMEKAGAGRDQIWRETGWFKGNDGKWRFEIDDSGAQLSGRKKGPFGDVLKNARVAAAYPDVAQVSAQRGGAGGSYIRETKYNDEMIQFGGMGDDARSVGLHEGQHAVQNREGFASGGSPQNIGMLDSIKASDEAMAAQDLATFSQLMEKYGDEYKAQSAMEAMPGIAAYRADRARDAFTDIGGISSDRAQALADEAARQAAAMQGQSPREMYNRLAGEVEARNVQTRRDFTPEERRARPPWTTQDVPDDQQIVRYGSGEARSEPPKAGPGQQITITSGKADNGKGYTVTAEAWNDRGRLVMSPEWPTNVYDDMWDAIGRRRDELLNPPKRGPKLVDESYGKPPKARPEWHTENPKAGAEIDRKVAERFVGLMNADPSPVHVLALKEGVGLQAIGDIIESGLPKGKQIFIAKDGGEIAVVDKAWHRQNRGEYTPDRWSPMSPRKITGEGRRYGWKDGRPFIFASDTPKPPPAQAGFGFGGKGPPKVPPAAMGQASAGKAKAPAPSLSKAAEEATRELKAARSAYNRAANKWVMKDDRELRVKPLEDRVVAAEQKLAQVLKNDAKLKTLTARGRAIIENPNFKEPLAYGLGGATILGAGMLGAKMLMPPKQGPLPMSPSSPEYYWTELSKDKDGMVRVQTALREWGEWPDDVDISGTNGKITKAAIRSWRARRGLDVDGPMRRADVARLLAGPKGYQDGKTWKYGDGQPAKIP